MLNNKTATNVKPENKISVVIVESNQKFCHKYSFAIEETPDIALAKMTGNKSEAIESIKYYAPDIVVLDLLLEDGISGLPVLNGIRSLQDSITQPGFLVITNNKNENLLDYCTKFMGVDTYYTKSLKFDSDDFVSKIRETYDLVSHCGVNMPDKYSQLPPRQSSSNADKILRLENMISARLEQDGMFIGKSTGRAYLIDLIVLAVQSRGMENYVINNQAEIVALKHNTIAQRVYRNVYNLIKRTFDFVTSPLYESNSSSPFVCNNKHRTPFSVIAFYAEVFRDALD